MRRVPSVNQIQYVPGVCNIGPAEIGRRRLLGWLGLFVSVALVVLLMWRGAPRVWGLLVFVPAALAASGFLQAHYRFCTGYAARGVYNFGPPGQSRAVPDEQAKRVDRRHGNRIALLALFIAAIAAALSMAVA